MWAKSHTLLWPVAASGGQRVTRQKKERAFPLDAWGRLVRHHSSPSVCYRTSTSSRQHQGKCLFLPAKTERNDLSTHTAAGKAEALNSSPGATAGQWQSDNQNPG